MPAIETADRLDRAVLWVKTGTDRYGEPKVAAPVEVMVRWVGKRSQGMDAQNNLVSVDATAVVDRDIPDGSTMWLGALADWFGTGSSGNDDDVMTVVGLNKTTDIRGRETRRTVMLKRFRDSPPTVG